MTAVLIAVTFGALALAGALLFSVLRLSRHERDQSEARTEALKDMIDDDPSSPAATRAPYAELLEVERGITPLQRAPMFADASADAGDARPRLLVPAIGALIVGLGLAGFYAWTRPQSAVAAPATSAPLELVSLRHETQGETLVVSGLVRNPPAGRAIKGLTAVAFTFDRQGTFLASGRAELDYQQLAAGEESPFSVSIPQSAGVGRYRVSFRTDAGVIPHVDRRGPTAPASTQVTK